MSRCSEGKFSVFILSFLLLILLASGAVAQEGRFTLKQCIDRALEENVDVLSARYSYGSAKQDYLEAWGRALPSASASATYRYTRSFGTQYDPVLHTTYQDPGSKSYGTGLTLSMTLFDGGRTWLNIKKYSEQKNSSKESLQASIYSTVFDIKQAYYNLVSAIMLKKVQADALARSKKQLEVTTTRYDLGSASLSEKLKQEVNVANDSLTLLERENDIRNAEFSLNLLMNRDPELPLTPLDSLTEVDFDMTVNEALKIAMDNNPTLRKSKADLSASKASLRMTQSNWIPNVTARMNWGWSTLNGDEWLKYKYQNGSYGFAITIGYTLFDAFTKKTDYTRSKLAARRSDEEYNAELKRVAQWIRQYYLDIQKSRLQYETAQLAEKSAQEDLKLQEEKYRLGASSILELLDAQYSLTNAQYNMVQALYSLNIAAAGMAQAMGRM
jgi:outer membrane protein